MSAERRLVYVIGAPGVGKSTALAVALGAGAQHERPVPHLLYGSGWCQLGRTRAAFSGTDALAFNVQPVVEEWLRDAAAPARIVAEGDRLANAMFFRRVQQLGYHLDVVYLMLEAALLAARRALRGSGQDERWVRSRETKVRRLAEDVAWPVHVVSADGSSEAVGAALWQFLQADAF